MGGGPDEGGGEDEEGGGDEEGAEAGEFVVTVVVVFVSGFEGDVEADEGGDVCDEV